MVDFIYKTIKRAAKKGLASGQEKYRTYFIKTNEFLPLKEEVDSKLIADNLGDCIVHS